MDKELLKNKLTTYIGMGETDPEAAHKKADQALLAYIDDEEVTEMFKLIKKYYS